VTSSSPAERLLQELGVTEPKEIDLEAIAWYVGCTVKYRELEGCEARILGAGNKAIITVSSSVSRTRKRFSLAHELGHWSHHRGRSFVCRSDDIANQNRGATDPERVADGYAADLILPRYLLKPYLDKIKRPSIDEIIKLSGGFTTSFAATAIRFTEMAPFPIVLVCHSKNGRKWFVRNRAVSTWYTPKVELDAESNAFDVVFGNKEKASRSLIGADAWFGNSRAEQYEIYEQTQRMGDEAFALLEITNEAMLEA
jgi:hypothetical protein